MADYLLLPVCARSVLRGRREQDVVRPLAEHGLEEMERAVPGVQGVAPPLLAAQRPRGAIVVETGLPKPVPVHEVLVPLLPPGTQSWLHDLVEGNFKATHTCTHARTHAHTHTHTRTHARTHAHTHTRACAQTQAIPILLVLQSTPVLIFARYVKLSL